MKKFMFLLLALVLFTACENTVNTVESDDDGKDYVESTKGNWNDTDKRLADAAVTSIDSQLDALGENKQAYIDCYLEKVEANYNSFSVANSDAAGCEKLALECVDELTDLMGGDSEVGNWTDKDIQQMADVIAEIDSDLESLGGDKQAFIDCYTSKLENNFKSFAAADNDVEGCEGLSEDCLDDLGYE